MTDFQKLGSQVQAMRAKGIPDDAINTWLSQADTSLEMLNASGFGPNSQRAKSPASGVESFGQGFGQGASMGFGDEVGAAAAATFGTPEGWFQPQGENWSDRYGSARDKIRGEMKGVQEANPALYGAGELAGAVAPAFVAPELYGSSAIQNAPSMGQAMLRSGGFGAGFGGLSALGHAEGTPEQQATETAMGSALGAMIGAAAPPVVNTLGKGTRWVYDKVRGMFSPAEEIVEAIPAAMPRAAQTQMPQQMPPPQVPPGMQQAPQTPLTPRSVASFDDVRPRATATVSPSDKTKAVNEVARALQRDGYSVEQIEQALNSLGPEATIADLGDATQRLLRTQKSAPGAAGNIIKTSLNNRQVGEQGRLLESVQKALGTKAGIYEADDVLLQRLDDEAAPFYQKAFAESANNPVGTVPVLEEIDKQLAKMPKNSPIRSAIERVRNMIGEEQEVAGQKVFQPYANLEVLHNAKMGIDDMLSNFGGDNSLGKVSKRAVMQIKDQLLKAMDEASPDYKQARQAFSGIMSGKDALEAGRTFIREDAEAIGRRLAEMPVEDQELYRIGGLRAIKDIIGSKPKDVSVVQLLRKSNLLDKVRELVPSEEAFNNYVRELENARRFAETRATALGGSQTAEKLLDATDQSLNLGSVASDVATGNRGGITSRLMDWVGGKFNNMVGPGEDARAKIAQILTSTDPAQRQDALQAIAAALSQQQTMRQGAAVVGSTGASQAGPAAGPYWRGRQQ